MTRWSVRRRCSCPRSSRPGTRPCRPPSSSRRAISSTSSARACARARTSSPIPTATSCACGRTSPCRPAACISNAMPSARQPGAYCYNGAAFRFQPTGSDSTHPREFRQAGIEYFGDADREAADAEIVALIRVVAACRRSQRESVAPRRPRPVSRAADVGRDAGALAPAADASLLAAGGVPRRAEAPGLGAGQMLDPKRRAFVATLDETDRDAAQAQVSAYLDGQGLELAGSRTLAEIAESLLWASADAKTTPLSLATADLIESYVAIRAPAPTRRGAGRHCRRAGPADGRRAVSHAIRSGWSCSRERRRSQGRRVLRRVRPQPRILHRLRVRGGARPARPRSPVAGGGRYDRLLVKVGAPARRGRRRRGHPHGAAAAAVGRTAHEPDKLVLAVPSKGRLMEQCSDLFARAGLTFRKTGHARGYRGEIVGLPEVEVAFVSAVRDRRSISRSAARISASPARTWCASRCRMRATRVKLVRPLGFGHADVVVAVPACWIDVTTMAELDEVSRGLPPRARSPAAGCDQVSQPHAAVLHRQGRHSGYRVVESLWRHEGTPAAGTAELIVDITTTGATLQGQRPAHPRRRRDPEIPGQPRLVQRRRLDRREQHDARRDPERASGESVKRFSESTQDKRREPPRLNEKRIGSSRIGQGRPRRPGPRIWPGR